MLLVYQKILDRDYGSEPNINNLHTSNMNSLSFTPRNWGSGERPDLIFDVVPWYDDLGLTVDSIGGIRRNADEAIFDLPDRISLMSYRNFYSGTNGLEDFTADVLSYLNTLNPAKPVTIGSEWLQNIWSLSNILA